MTLRTRNIALTAFVATASLAGCGGDDGEQVADPPAATHRIGEIGDGERIPIVVDYSPTLSDVTALLYLAEHPAVDLRAVTLAGTGESHCDAALPNTKALLELAGHPDVPVACGRSEPVGPGNAWPEEWRDAADDLPGLDLPVADNGGAAIDAADLLAETAGSANDLVVIALGPLTNLAVAIDHHPSMVDEVAMLYSMGGAIDVAGNAPNGTSEWNYYVDPMAVDMVVRSGIPMTLVPLDATNDVPVTAAWFTRLGEHPPSSSGGAVLDLFGAGRPWDFGFSFWDELTAAVALDESLVTVEDVTIEVVADGSDSGRTIAAPDGTPVRVVTNPDRQRFESDLLSTLAGND